MRVATPDRASHPTRSTAVSASVPSRPGYRRRRRSSCSTIRRMRRRGSATSGPTSPRARWCRCRPRPPGSRRTNSPSPSATRASSPPSRAASNWLPAVDFDVRPMDNVVLRASGSIAITRPDYASMQGGRTLNSLFNIAGGTGSQGNPGLLPYKSKNLDLSAEFYYAKDSYISVGYFLKGVSNFLSSTRVETRRRSASRTRRTARATGRRSRRWGRTRPPSTSASISSTTSRRRR
ncbi:TonB-dependent receptor domain-containing protein [Sphingomonas sp. MMS24-JH45]